MHAATFAHAEPLEQTWRTIEELIDQVAGAAASGLPPAEFHQLLLERSVSALAATAAVFWRWSQGQWQPGQEISLDPAASVPLRQPGHLQLLSTVARQGQPRLVLPGGSPDGLAAPGAAGPWMLMLAPVLVEGRTVGVLEVLQRPTADVPLQQGMLNVVAALAEAAGDFHRRRELCELRAAEAARDQAHQFTCRVHAANRLRETAYAIVNEGRRLLAVDRVALAVRHGKGYRLLAVSGVERLERRAATVGQLERLACLVAATREPLRCGSGAQAAVPDELDALLQPYLDETHVRTIELFPLDPPPEDETGSTDAATRPAGVLIVERFQAAAEPAPAHALPVVCAHARIALENALRRRSLLGRAADWWSQAGRRWQAAAVLGTVAAAIAAAALIPAEFSIPARGELVPQHRQDVFAPRDGQIRELAVEHDMLVEQDQPLAEMVSAELELEFRRLVGQQQTTQQKLLAARSERTRRTPGEDRQRLASWSAVEQELESELDSLREQLDVVRQEMARLQIRSPLRGRVQTWDVRRLLEARPVARGQVLMTVADVEGPWILELKIADHHVRHVLAARETAGDVPVSFVLKTAPDVRHRGTLQELGLTTAAEEQQPPYLQAVVAVDRQQLPLLRSGTAVLARIECGRASLGYVWLHDLIDTVRTWLFF